MAAPEIVTNLVERFGRNKNVYRGRGYNETRLRREFVDRFFEALGWDVDNKRGVSPLYEEVIHEYGTEVEGSKRTADYAFRVGEKAKFFVEAKEPGVRLKEDPRPALQLRRYAFSASLPLSILTDFEEFAAYDGRVPPKKVDSASRARLMYFTYDQYVDAWDEIAAVFSRDAVWSGAFDKYAGENRGGKAEPVDKLFLKMLEGWRDELARNVANRNRDKDLDKYELSAAVQAILDRIVFLRVAGDRGIEDRGRLEALRHGEGVYAGLMELCLEADDVYNSGLFHFRDEKGRATSRDELTPALHVDDALLRKVLRELYDSPYEFGVVPVEILGQVYERFLGKTIRLDGRGVHIDYKPEFRKDQGVYYTPHYIVEYIVKNTVGELLEGCKNPKAAAKLKILDPACGSGSFLLGAYQHLINWHLEWYVADGPDKHEGKVVATPGPGPVSWRLTAAAKKDILLNNLFGVDIDPQAVEVTKLSLLLKALEGESRESVGAQTKFLRERVLPDLGDNVKCGNSLIGSDYWDFVREKQEGRSERTEEEERRVNPFDWEVEFPVIMKAGGFDAVIGNPPYYSIDDTWGKGDSRLSAIKKLYPSVYNDKTDILFYFLAKGIAISRGFVSFIVSRAFLEAYKADKLRLFLTENTRLERLIDFRNFLVFTSDNRKVGITTCIVNLRPGLKPGNVEVFRLIPEELPEYNLPRLLNNEEVFEKIEYPQKSLGSASWVFVAGEKEAIFNKVDSRCTPLGEILIIGQGMQTGRNSIFGNKRFSEIENWNLKPGMFFKRARNSAINRFYIADRGEYLLYLEKIDRFENLPEPLKDYLMSKRAVLKERAAYKRGDCDWWRFTWPLHKEYYDRPKILTPYLAERNRFAIDANKEYIGLTDTTVSFDKGQAENILYLLGLLNSIFLTFRFKSIGKFKGGGIYEYFWNSVSRIPIRTINFEDPADAARHDKMVALVEEILALHKRLAAAKSDADKKRIQRAVDTTDRNINNLVYELYGLTDEEIKIVEGS